MLITCNVNFSQCSIKLFLNSKTLRESIRLKESANRFETRTGMVR